MNPLAWLGGAWWTRREAALRVAHAEVEAKLQAELKAHEEGLRHVLTSLSREESDLQDQERRVKQRQVELAQTNEELRTQIQLLEAKASPSGVWAEAMGTGFRMAFEMLLPLMREGYGKAHNLLFDAAVNDTLQNLEGTIQRRLTEAGQGHLRPLADLQAKRADFVRKREDAVSEADKERYDHYVKALDWALAGTNGN